MSGRVGECVGGCVGRCVGGCVGAWLCACSGRVPSRSELEIVRTAALLIIIKYH